MFKKLNNYYKNEISRYKPAPWKRSMLIICSTIFCVVAVYMYLSKSPYIKLGEYFAIAFFGLTGLVGVAVGIFGSKNLVAKVLGGV